MERRRPRTGWQPLSASRSPWLAEDSADDWGIWRRESLRIRSAPCTRKRLERRRSHAVQTSKVRKQKLKSPG